MIQEMGAGNRLNFGKETFWFGDSKRSNCKQTKHITKLDLGKSQTLIEDFGFGGISNTNSISIEMKTIQIEVHITVLITFNLFSYIIQLK